MVHEALVVVSFGRYEERNSGECGSNHPLQAALGRMKL